MNANDLSSCAVWFEGRETTLTIESRQRTDIKVSMPHASQPDPCYRRRRLVKLPNAIDHARAGPYLSLGTPRGPPIPICPAVSHACSTPLSCAPAGPSYPLSLASLVAQPRLRQKKAEVFVVPWPSAAPTAAGQVDGGPSPSGEVASPRTAARIKRGAGNRGLRPSRTSRRAPGGTRAPAAPLLGRARPWRKAARG